MAKTYATNFNDVNKSMEMNGQVRGLEKVNRDINVM